MVVAPCCYWNNWRSLERQKPNFVRKRCTHCGAIWNSSAAEENKLSCPVDTYLLNIEIKTEQLIKTTLILKSFKRMPIILNKINLITEKTLANGVTSKN